MIRHELRRFAIAFRGLFFLFIKDSHGRFHFVAFIAVIIAGFCFHVSATEWIALLFASALVICAEGFNTAIEKLSDVVQPATDERIRFIKDTAAGAVLITAIIAFAVACIIFIPKIF